MAPGTHFKPVIGADVANPASVRKIVFVCGKHYYPLARHVAEKGVSDTAVVRLEQLCPFPTKELQDEVKKYPNAKSKLSKSFFKISKLSMLLEIITGSETVMFHSVYR